MMSLTQMAVDVLTTQDGRGKTTLSRHYAKVWFEARANGTVIDIGKVQPPLQPARPEKPTLLSPREVPKRKPGTLPGQIALLHAVVHIKLNAVDLHWDIIPRFRHIEMPPGFYDDWVKAADDESKYFNMMCDCLEALDSYYGALTTNVDIYMVSSIPHQTL